MNLVTGKKYSEGAIGAQRKKLSYWREGHTVYADKKQKKTRIYVYVYIYILYR